jgi:hypothetical protein
MDTTIISNSPYYNQWLVPATIIAALALIFAVFQYRQKRKFNKPAFTFVQQIKDIDGEHIVVKIASNYTGPIHSIKFYACRIILGFVHFKKLKLSYRLIEDQEEIQRYDSNIERTSFKEEQLFWLFIKDSSLTLKGKYWLYAKTSVGNCSTTYYRKGNKYP